MAKFHNIQFNQTYLKTSNACFNYAHNVSRKSDIVGKFDYKKLLSVKKRSKITELKKLYIYINPGSKSHMHIFVLSPMLKQMLRKIC